MSNKTQLTKKPNPRYRALLIGFGIGASFAVIFAMIFFVFVEPSLLVGRDVNPTPPGSTNTIRSLPTGTDTPQISPLPTLTLTLTATPLITFNDRLVAAQDDIQLAERSMENGEFAEAILSWDRVIAQVPDFPNAYYQRGLSYHNLMHVHQNPEDDRQNALDAFEDLSMAIELNPYIGDYYYFRSEVADFMSSRADTYWVDTLPWNQIFLEDTVKAVELRSSYQWNNRTPGFALIRLGRCEEALDFFERLLQAQGDTPPSAGISTGFAQAYNCLREHEKALDAINSALEIYFEYDRLMIKALILVHLDRYQEALQIYNQLIDELHGATGNLYYGRAYIYYEMGEPELTLEDIRTGEFLTWGRYEIRAYLLGRLAIDDGDLQTGLEWLQLAEATFWPYSPIYDKIVAEIESLGGTFLYPTPAPPPEFGGTPIPVVSDQLYATPTSPPNLFANTILANYNGLGPFVFQPFDYLVFMFRPNCDPVFGTVKSIIIKVVGGPEGQELPLLMQTINQSEGGYGNPTNLVYGEQELRNPGRYVDLQGYLYLAIRNFSDKVIVVENIQIRMAITESLGVEKVCGFR